MKTKIVYVLVSLESDIYLEQAWVSIFSLRHFNKEVAVEIVCDDRTAERIRTQSPEEFRQLAGKIVSVPFAEDVSNRERSRWLKTNLRNLVNGDFLFLDTDTIITDSLSEIDTFGFDLGMVYSWHCRMSERPNMRVTKNRIKSLFGKVLKDETDYFNSGVIFCKDTETTHRFFSKWHENWESAKDKPNGIQDQQSLAVTVDELGGVYAISGIYNCQPIYSMKYISTAKIVHFFNIKRNNYSPFNSKDFYLDLKGRGYVSEEDARQILNCRSTFVTPAYCVCGDDIIVNASSSYKMLVKLYHNHKFIYRALNFISMKLGVQGSNSF